MPSSAQLRRFNDIEMYVYCITLYAKLYSSAFVELLIDVILILNFILNLNLLEVYLSKYLNITGRGGGESVFILWVCDAVIFLSNTYIM